RRRMRIRQGKGQFVGRERLVGRGRHGQRNLRRIRLLHVRALEQHRQKDDRQRSQHGGADQALFQRRIHTNTRPGGGANYILRRSSQGAFSAAATVWKEPKTRTRSQFATAARADRRASATLTWAW